MAAPQNLVGFVRGLYNSLAEPQDDRTTSEPLRGADNTNFARYAGQYPENGPSWRGRFMTAVPALNVFIVILAVILVIVIIKWAVPVLFWGLAAVSLFILLLMLYHTASRMKRSRQHEVDPQRDDNYYYA